MRTYKWDDLRELYRIDNKYWKTGDIDILHKRMAVAQQIDERFWSEISSIASLITRKHMPFNKFVEVLEVLGYEAEGMRGEANEHDK